MVRVAVINPPSPSIVQTWDRPSYPCLAIGYLSGILKSSGIDTLAIDAPFDGLSLTDLKNNLFHFKPDIMCFTSMTHRIVNVAQVALDLKKVFRKSQIIIGGPHATVVPENILREFPIFDVAVVGEGELTLLELIQSFKDFSVLKFSLLPKERLASITGIVWRDGDKIKVNSSRKPIENLDSLPFPDYGHINRKIDIYPIFSSRGCPHQCIFCNRIHGTKLRLRSPDNVVAEIEHALEKHNPEIIDFADDTFTLPKERTIKICEIIVKKGIHKQLRWTALSRVTGINQLLFKKMKEAGCVKVDFGVESGNQKILKIIKKGITLSDAMNAVKMAKIARLKTGSYFILGHPYETVQTIHDTINFAIKLNTNTVAFGIMVPYPGTEVHEMVMNGQGNYKLISNDWNDFDKQFGNALELKDLSRKELEKYQIKAYLLFYINNFRIIDVLKIIISQRRLIWRILNKRLAVSQ